MVMSFFFFRYLLFSLITLMITAPVMALEVFVLTNKSNPSVITNEKLDRILKAQQLHWDSGQPIMIVMDELDTISSEDFMTLTSMSKAQFMEFWRIKFFSGRALIPRQVSQSRYAHQLIQDFNLSLYVVIGRKPDEKMTVDENIRVTKLNY